MHDLEKIFVSPAPRNTVNVYNPTAYELIGQGAQGAVFKISRGLCVKIYTANKLADREFKAYRSAGGSPIRPEIYHKGTNYIIMEYLKGPSLDKFLEGRKRVPGWVTVQLLKMLGEMRRLGFKRLDSALRHIFITKDKRLKVIDLMHAFTINTTVPALLLGELKKKGMLENFLEQVKEIDISSYREWERWLREKAEKKRMKSLEVKH